MEFFNNRTGRLALIIMLIFLAATVFVESYLIKDISLSKIFTSWETLLSFTKELFFASFIAVFIIATVEQASKREQSDILKKSAQEFSNLLERKHQIIADELKAGLSEMGSAANQAQRNVFNAIYKNRLAEVISEEVEESVFRSSFVRTSHSRVLKLVELPDHPDHILMKSEQHFKVKNITASERPYTPTAIIPKPPGNFSGLSCVQSISVSPAGDKASAAQRYPIKSQGNKMHDFLVDGEGEDEDVYSFPSVEVPAHSEIEVRVELQLVKDRSDNEIWTSLIPTVVSDVTVISEVNNLYIGAISLHRGVMESEVQVAGHRRWKVNRPILPYQGYVVFWRKKEGEIAAKPLEIEAHA